MTDDATSSPLLGQSAWGLIGELTLVGGGLINFVALLRLLTVSDYGIVGSIQGIAAPAFALASMGAPFLMVRTVSRGGDRQEVWQRTLTSVIMGSLAVTVLLVILQPFILGPAALLPYALLLVSTGALAAFQELYFGLAMAIERIELGVASRIIGVGARLGGLALFAVVSDQSLTSWAWFAFVSNVIGCVAITLLLSRPFGIRFRLVHPKTWIGNARQGYGFAMNGVSEGVLDASDRPVLQNAGFAEVSGHYSAAARMVTFSYIPVLALFRVITPRIMRGGETGPNGAYRATLRLVPTFAGLGGIVSLLTFVLAPLPARLIGDSYQPSIEILRWLAIVPFIKVIQYLAGNALDAGQRQFVRLWLTLAAAGLNLTLNIIFIPRYSWRAAVTTTLIAETALLVALWGALIVLSRRGSQEPSTQEDEARTEAEHAQP